MLLVPAGQVVKTWADEGTADKVAMPEIAVAPLRDIAPVPVLKVLAPV